MVWIFLENINFPEFQQLINCQNVENVLELLFRVINILIIYIFVFLQDVNNTAESSWAWNQICKYFNDCSIFCMQNHLFCLFLNNPGWVWTSIYLWHQMLTSIEKHIYYSAGIWDLRCLPTVVNPSQLESLQCCVC